MVVSCILLAGLLVFCAFVGACIERLRRHCSRPAARPPTPDSLPSPPSLEGEASEDPSEIQLRAVPLPPFQVKS